jgi:hypothetical protein
MKLADYLGVERKLQRLTLREEVLRGRVEAFGHPGVIQDLHQSRSFLGINHKHARYDAFAF